MSTPTPGKARQSGIPTPGKGSSIPTPGRLRSTSSAAHYPPNQDQEYITKAFADAIKANDPAQHRPGRTSDVSSTSLSPSLASFASQNGRRSVAGRPSSVASSSSAASLSISRTPAATPKTSAPRPASRQSDVFTRSSSRAGKPFDLGDSVRIESLGFEGTLKYLGEIDGKPGYWAGVELSGGFAGKGKNDGTVNGKQYFVCRPNCGVFVATTKLSAPTVSYASSSRPSSVASSRNGRVTPSMSMSGRITPSTSTSMSTGRKTPSISMSNGRTTPSFSSGRMTPSASTGRRTPGMGLPMSRSRTAPSQQGTNTVTPARKNTIGQSNITPGSRASKYVGMTAKQLSTRSSGPDSPSRPSVGSGSPTTLSSPMQGSTHLPSPTRPSYSPFNTPKAMSGGRTSNIGVGFPSTTPNKLRTANTNTPRARIPSAIAMPPPASPSAASQSLRSVSLNEPHRSAQDSGSLPDLELNAKVLQDKITELMAGRMPSGSRPTSAASVGSSPPAEIQGRVDSLQSQLNALEEENQRLRAAAANEDQERADRVEKLLAEQKRGAARIVELEASLRTNERLVSERDSTIEHLERAAKETEKDIDKIKGDADARIRDIQSKLEDKEALVVNLKELIEAKEGLQTENAAVLQAKDAEIALLEARVQKAYTELEDERLELGSQVDELRKAGQETIALYEERLSAADSQRYELEDLIASLQDQLRKQAEPLSPTTAQRHAASAAEIDNETLREQVQHLQKRVALLEDQLEEAHATFDREEAAVRERVKRYKDREDGMRKELDDGRKEVQRVLKSEESARQRIEEMEEALRENKVALENARAEIEGLRGEISDLEGITSGISSGNSSDRIAELAQRSTAERARLVEEVAELKRQLAVSLTTSNGGLNGDSTREVAELHELISTLQSERTLLQQICEERTAELEALRKKLNRDIPVNGLESTKSTSSISSPSKYDLAAARDEITGLKHIVQELQKENSAAAQRNKALESENKLLLSETEQLREDLKMLEENVEQSILREEQALSTESSSGGMGLASGDIALLQKKYEAELEQVRKKLMEVEMKNARTIHDLNKEIGELETLIESKIYREDELERELERLKDKLARSQKKSSKTSTGLPLSSSSETVSKQVESDAGATEVCEICERPGHDIFSCDLLKEEATPLSMAAASSGGAAEELFCEDCEGRGHTAANCPHSLDVF